MNFIVMDTETGGLDCEKHSLLSVAMLKTTARFQILDELHIKIRHDIFHLDAEGMETNRLDIREAKQWMSVKDAKKTVLEFLGITDSMLANDKQLPSYTACGTNIQFDVGFMKKFMGEDVWNKIFFHRLEEITSNFREMQKNGIIPATRGYKQFMMLEALGIEFEHDELHDALNDARLAASLAREMQLRNDILKTALRAYVARHGNDLDAVIKAYHKPDKLKALKRLRKNASDSSKEGT